MQVRKSKKMEKLTKKHQRQENCSNPRSTQVSDFHCNSDCICTWVGVIACGHYWIPSNKSNVCFPAFLVRLPQLFAVEQHLRRREKLEEKNSCTPIHQQLIVDDCNPVKYQYRWRSKRDFLLMKHAATSLYNAKKFSSKSATSASHRILVLLYPKSSVDKLCERATMQGPWVSPHVIMHNGDVPLNGTTSNSWVPQQQKSLQMVNGYLRHMYQIYCYCLHELSHNGGSDETCLRFKGVFEIFCQEKDPVDIILHTETPPAFCSNCRSIISRKSTMKLSANNKISSRSPIVTSSLLGQYFASTENVDYVIKRLLQTLISMKLCANTCIFVEPSVGDGRILSKLISSSEQFITATTNQTWHRQERSHDSKYEQSQKSFCCLGYDIDPSAVQKAYETLLQDTTTRPHKDVKSTILCQDFLTVTYQDIINHLPCSITNGEFPRHEQHIIVVGGPPYTVEGRNDDDDTCSSCCNNTQPIRVDLAKRFVLHSLLSLRATAVIFILPQRCKWQATEIHRELSMHSDTRVEAISDQTSSLETDGRHSSGEASPQHDMLSNLKGSCSWSDWSEALPNNHFDFHGKWVKQPSILQIWICTRQHEGI